MKADKRGKVSSFMSFAGLLARRFGVTLTGVNPSRLLIINTKLASFHNLHNFTINSLPHPLNCVDRVPIICRKSHGLLSLIRSLQQPLVVHCKHVVCDSPDLVFWQVNIPKLTLPFLSQWYFRLHQLLGREGPQIHHRDPRQWTLALGIQRIRLGRSCC